MSQISHTRKPELIVILDDDVGRINNFRAYDDTRVISKEDLPKPSFRQIGDYDYKKRKHTIAAVRKRRLDYAKESYFRYDEPTPEELIERVEYDMDDVDEDWLKSMNKKLQTDYQFELSESDFELIMDRLEKESYFESKRAGKEIVPEVDDDAVCAICLDGDSLNANLILLCDMCDLAVHQECYGVPYIPEGPWHCRRCLQSPSKGVDCVLCPNKGGAFKQTEDNRWAHVICALWIPEVCFANTVFLEPIDNISQIPPARWKLTCYICKQKRNGACIQCHKPNCYVPFHVTCAQQAGLYMRIRTHFYEGKSGSYSDVMKEAFCDAHTPRDKSKKQGMYSSDETDTETEEDDAVSKSYYRLKQGKKNSISKTRKILAEKRASDPNPVCEPVIQREKLAEISELITIKGKRKRIKRDDELRKEIIRRIEGYWLMKRKERKGVPLLRRLQVSYGNNTKSDNSNIETEKYIQIRYSLEKARLLVGEVKKRELLKKRMFKLSKEIVGKRLELIDCENPATED